MKILITYYSRTGVTKKIGDELAKLLKADVDEIQGKTSYEGGLGYIKGGKEATFKQTPDIVQNKDPSKYDLVIIGTPIWSWNMSSVTRSYLKNNNFKKVAFFCTQGGSGDSRAFSEMEELSSKPLATLAILTKDVIKNNHDLKDFISKIN